MSDKAFDNICWIFAGLISIYMSIKILPFFVGDIFFSLLTN